MATLEEDRALAQAVVRGDAKAAETLFEQVFENLWRQVTARLGGDVQLAEDVVGEALLAGLRGLPSYRGEASLSTWFFRIALRKIADHLRRRAVDLVARGNGNLETVLLPANGTSALDRMIDEELRAIVVEALDLLPDCHRDVLRWRYFDDSSVVEVAERLQSSVKAAERRLARARAALASALRRRGVRG